MSYSVTEIQTLAQKAARGAGFPPSQAEAFGRAAALHLAEGGAPEVLLAGLATPGDSPILRLPLLMDDILRAREALGNEVTLSLHGDDGQLAPVYARALPLGLRGIDIEEIAGEPSKLHITLDPEARTPCKLPPRVDAPQALIDRLNDLAARTYVPATEESRLKGAGAGLTDND
ncbi:hypothetical protein [Aestuariicoccus sp. MJ-SS9]|uniref:hypothetical protein n=1 Tax=Aestuariicoccus sp. MJ-SS9 TaxID=3079855 RepID=UPI00290C3D61|nr:hypothetical protein [Aestuariicoccus sp. MJ-SS9]MDU8911813.1 hypothetical protein [Aestuariicoccus sp. MJ-SS9]